MNTNTNYLELSSSFGSGIDTNMDAAMMDPFEQYLNFSLATLPAPAINPPFNFDQRCQSQPTSYVPLSDTFNRAAESVQLLFQDKPSLSAAFSSLVLTDPYDMAMPLPLTQDLLPLAATQTFQLPSPSQLLSSRSFSSFAMYEDALGMTWPTSEVSFEDFDMQDLSFLDIPFTPTTAVATTAITTTTEPLLDFQSQPNQFLTNNNNNTSNDSVIDGLGYSIAPPLITPTATTTTTPATNMLPYLVPPQAQPLQSVPVPASSYKSVNPFRKMANVSNLYLLQIGTSSPLPHLSETAPANLPLLWSTFPSVQPTPPPSLPPSAPTMAVTAVAAAQSTPVQPVQDAIICQSYSPTAFVLDGSMIAKKLASRKQSVSASPFRRNSAPIGSANVIRRSPYARSRYPQEPKKRRTEDEEEEEQSDSSTSANSLKLQKTAELSGSTTATPKYLEIFDAPRRQYNQPFPTLSILLSPPSPPSPTTITTTTTSAATTTTPPNRQKIKSKGKSGRKSTLKKITDCAHYRPRNAFFMFRGFVSHIHTYLHAKRLSVSSGTSSSSDSAVPSSCSMTSTASTTRPDDKKGNDSNGSALTPSPNSNFPTPHSDTRQGEHQRQLQPHLSLSLSLHLPPTSSTTTQSPPSPYPSHAPTTAQRPRYCTRQAQTKVSVSCGKIWSSPCLPTCTPRSTGCANCRMRSLFRQASDYLKLRQTEIERLIEFPLLPREDGERRRGMLRLVDSFNWKEFEALYPESDLFKWHREYYANYDNDNDNKEGKVLLDVEEMKAIWMESELEYEKVFSEGARKRITQEGLKATTEVVNSSCSNKRAAAPIANKE